MDPRETENNAYAKFGVTDKDYYGLKNERDMRHTSGSVARSKARQSG